MDTIPDWNQYDEKSLDYVKNRTHYTEPVFKQILVESAFTERLSFDLFDYPYTDVEGKQAIIVFDGVEYKQSFRATQIHDKTYSPIIYHLGNIALDPTYNTSAYAVDTGEPFYIRADGYAIARDATKEHTITLSVQDGETVHQLPKKYIQDSLDEHTMDNIPDWNQNDETSLDYIKNKPTIPTKTSQITNDSGFITAEDIPETQAPDLSDYAKKKDIPTSASQVGADTKGTAESKVSEHNTSEISHNDIRLLIEGLTNRLNALADSDDTTLDQMSEIVAYIKSNKSLIDVVTTNKVNVADIIDNLTTSVGNKPLSAKQGVMLKGLIDAIKVPSKLSDLAGDSSHRTVTDTEKESWNNKSNFSGNYNDLTNKPTIPTKTSDLENDSNFSTFSGFYSDLVNKPQIPFRVSELINDRNYVSVTDLPDFEVWEFELEDGTTVAKKVYCESLYQFTIDDVVYYFEGGMVWGEWVASKYNTNEFMIGSYDYLISPDLKQVSNSSGQPLYSAETIDNDYAYTIENDAAAEPVSL